VENGVPLEHLVSCLSSVDLRQDIGSVKYIAWTGRKDHESNHDGNFLLYESIINSKILVKFIQVIV